MKAYPSLRNANEPRETNEWTLALQEYNLIWEYMPGQKNLVADNLSRVNTEEGIYENYNKEKFKVYNIIKKEADLKGSINRITMNRN